MTKEVYSTTEIAKEQGVSDVTVQNWINAGKLTAHKLGRDWAVLAADYEAFKEKRRADSA